MSHAIVPAIDRRLRTPRSAAIAGIVFAVLFGSSNVLVRISIPADPAASGAWLETRQDMLSFALVLLPFAGIAFLWFIGVLRDRLGDLEDRFFATVFFGSGLLFLAMTFSAAAVAGSLLSTYGSQGTAIIESGLFAFGRGLMFRVANIYAIKMAAVFMMSLGTIWLRTGTMPRVLTLLTYSMAAVLLVSISFSLWAMMIFPGWVLAISIYILVGNLRMREQLTPPEA